MQCHLGVISQRIRARPEAWAAWHLLTFCSCQKRCGMWHCDRVNNVESPQNPVLFDDVGFAQQQTS